MHQSSPHTKDLFPFGDPAGLENVWASLGDKDESSLLPPRAPASGLTPSSVLVPRYLTKTHLSTTRSELWSQPLSSPRARPDSVSLHC